MKKECLEVKEDKVKKEDVDVVLEKKPSKTIYSDVCSIIDTSQSNAYKAVNVELVKRNWLIGERISKEILKGKSRAGYGETVIKDLSAKLVKRYGNGFSKRNLHYFYLFYIEYPNIVHTMCAQSDTPMTPPLTWCHYRELLKITDKKVRDFYEKVAKEQMWTVRDLQHNIMSEYYYRNLQVQKEGLQLDGKLNDINPKLEEQLEFCQNPIIADFLNIKPDIKTQEKDLETKILDHLEEYMISMGKGFTLFGRQVLIRTENATYHIDLVFYNYYLQSFVLVELKTNKITASDVGQIDMYVNMWDKLKKPKNINPTLGMIVTSKTDSDVAMYSHLHDSNNLLMAEYKSYMPSAEQLKAEIENQKTMFLLQHQKEKVEENINIDLSFTEESVFNLIKENNKISNNQIMKELNKSEPTIHRAISSLINKGYIKAEGISQNRVFIILNI